MAKSVNYQSEVKTELLVLFQHFIYHLPSLNFELLFPALFCFYLSATFQIPSLRGSLAVSFVLPKPLSVIPITSGCSALSCIS